MISNSVCYSTITPNSVCYSTITSSRVWYSTITSKSVCFANIFNNISSFIIIPNREIEYNMCLIVAYVLIVHRTI